MIISLSELLYAGDGKINISAPLDSIKTLLTPKGTRKIAKDKIHLAIDFVNENELWDKLDYNLLFFQDTFQNASLLIFTKDEVKIFIENVILVSENKSPKLRKINNTLIADRLDKMQLDDFSYSLNWVGKKKSMLRCNYKKDGLL